MDIDFSKKTRNGNITKGLFQIDKTPQLLEFKSPPR